MVRFLVFILVIFPLMTMFKMALNLPQCVCQLCYSFYVLQPPAMFLPWCFYSIISEIASWFIKGELLLFALLQSLLYCFLQFFFPLFWWLCLCYEAYLGSNLLCSSSVSPQPNSVLSFCRSRCIYSSYQLNGSFKFLDSCSRCSSSQVLLFKAGSLYHSWCPSFSSPFVHALSYVPQGGWSVTF